MDLTLLADGYVRLGGGRAFGIPGGGPSLALVDALEKRGVPFLTTGHETTAALMAGAFARQSRQPALAITIKGPGFMNLAPGLLCNAYEGYPMLSLAEAYGSAVGARRHKWLDHRQAAGGFLKAHHFLAEGGVTLEECWNQARAEFPGPVHADLASGSSAPALAGPNLLNSDDPAPVMAALRRATRPLLVAGSLALRAPWRKLLPTLQIPVFTTPAAKGALDERLPFAAGVYTGDGKPLTPEKRIMPQADFVLGLGLRAGEVLNPAPPHANYFCVETLALKNRALFPPPAPLANQLFLAEEVIAEILGALRRGSWGEEAVAASRAAMRQRLCESPWSPGAVTAMVQEVFQGAAHVLDTGNFTVVAEHLLQVADERAVLGTPNGRFMGAGIGYALGAALAEPQRPVVLWIGDGGIRAFFSELTLAAENRLRLLVLVMKDGFFGSVRGRALTQGWTQAPLVVPDRGLARLAAHLGFSSGCARNAGELDGFLQSWARDSGPALLECEFNADDYGRWADLLR